MGSFSPVLLRHGLKQKVQRFLQLAEVFGAHVHLHEPGEQLRGDLYAAELKAARLRGGSVRLGPGGIRRPSGNTAQKYNAGNIAI